MADYKSLVLSNDFKEYRKKQLVEIVTYINTLIKESSTSELKGALEMANRLVRLPSILVNDNDAKTELNAQILTDLIGISAGLVRQALED